LGLALSYGSPLNETHVLFSTSTPHTINAVGYGFGSIKVYVARYMISLKTKKRICVYNLLTYDPIIAKEVRRIKNSKKNNISSIISDLQNSKEFLAQFLAGVIDGDGTIDKDNIRISFAIYDPLYEILNKIFEGKTRYDEKKYMLRISTKALRAAQLIDPILKYMVESHKKLQLKKLLRKKPRFECSPITLTNDKIESILEILDDVDKSLLLSFKLRMHRKYIYAYMSVNSKTSIKKYTEVYKVFQKIGKILNVDLHSAIKLGNREIVIYNQNVVKLIRKLKDAVEEG
jgi:hypothetical protein